MSLERGTVEARDECGWRMNIVQNVIGKRLDGLFYSDTGYGWDWMAFRSLSV